MRTFNKSVHVFAAVLIMIVSVATAPVAHSATLGEQELKSSVKKPKKPKKTALGTVKIESFESGPSPEADCGLPNSSQVVDVFGVPKKRQIRVYIGVDTPVYQDVQVGVQISNRAVAEIIDSSGAKLEKIFVTIKAGERESERFILRGIEVAQTQLDVDPFVDVRLPPEADIQYLRGLSPVVVWDVSDYDVVDYNALGETGRECYDPNGSPALKGTIAERTICGERADAVAADGASLQLIRLKSGGYGKACFSIIKNREQDAATFFGRTSDALGGLETPAKSVNAVPGEGNEYWAFGTYTPPTEFVEDSLETRSVEVEIQFFPLKSDGSTTRSHATAIRKTIQLRRPPVLLLHGLWSNMGAWDDDAFKAERNGWFIDNSFDYPNSVPVSRSAPVVSLHLDMQIRELREGAQFGGERIAATKFDLIGHSLGSVVSRKLMTLGNYRNAQNFFKGKVRKFIALAGPQAGTQIANMIINLHETFSGPTPRVHGPSEALWWLELPGTYHGGAVCDLAENSNEMNYPAVQDVKTFAITASKGSTTRLDGFNLLLYFFFLGQDKTDHLDPYVFPETNDTQVLLRSQNLDGQMAFNDHNFVNHGELKNDRGIADETFYLLDRDGSVGTMSNGIPSHSISTLGRTEHVVGRGTDALSYLHQCTPGGPMMPLQ